MIAIIDGVEAARWAWILTGLATEQAANHYADLFVSRLRQRPQSLEPLKEYWLTAGWVAMRMRSGATFAEAMQEDTAALQDALATPPKTPPARQRRDTPPKKPTKRQRWENRQWDDDEDRQPDPKGAPKGKGKRGGKGSQPKRHRQEEQWQRWDYNQSEWHQNYWQNRPREEWRGHEKDSTKESKQGDRR